ncbi:MAG: hypothetical protein ABMB14_03310 [Myxococcota bacterium]
MTVRIASADQARLNVTWNGQNGDLPDAVSFRASDAEIKAWAVEALRNGDVPGIAADRRATLDGFVVDRFSATREIPYNRLFVRPKTPFGRS